MRSATIKLFLPDSDAKRLRREEISGEAAHSQVVHATMRYLLASLLLLALASCDFGYGVYRTTPVGSRLDPADLASWAEDQPGHHAADDHAWDGKCAWFSFAPEPGAANVLLQDGQLTVQSFRIGPPTDSELDVWLVHHASLVSALRKRFVFLPPIAEWQVTSNLDDRLPAAMARVAHRE